MKKEQTKEMVNVADPVFKTNVTLFWGYTFDEMNEVIKDNIDKEVEDDFRGSNGIALTLPNKDGVIYQAIWLSSTDWTLKEQAVFAHELTHIVFDVCSHKGITILRDDPNEVYAYLYEYYFLRFCREIQKVIDNVKPKKNVKNRNSRNTSKPK